MKRASPNAGRPERHPANRLIIQQSAGAYVAGGSYAVANAFDEIQRNNRLIYSGALADGRALRGKDGVYTVQVLRPLEVTDHGIAINLHDPMFRVNVLGTGSAVPELVVGLPYGEDTGGSAGDGPGIAFEDHMHAMDLTEQVGVTVDLLGTGMTAGAAILPARGDHVHFHGVATVGGTQSETFYAPVSFSGSTAAQPSGPFIVFKQSHDDWDGLGHSELDIHEPFVYFPVTGGSNYPPAAHNLLDGNRHPDTVAGQPEDGYLVVGNGNAPSKWQVFVKGAAGRLLSVQADGTGLEWIADPVEGSLIVGDAQPQWAPLAQGTARQRLAVQADGSGLEWVGQIGEGDAIELVYDEWIDVQAANANETSVDGNDWRGRMIRYFTKTSNYVGADVTPAQADDQIWAYVDSGYAHYGISIGADDIITASGGGAAVRLYIDKDNGHLYVTVPTFQHRSQHRFHLTAGRQRSEQGATAPDRTIVAP